MSRRTLFLLFVAACLAQLAVPAHMLWQRERVLRAGTPVRFRTEPVDPVDALRGRYVALGFEADEAPTEPGCCDGVDRPIAPLRIGEDGFARLGPLRATAPEEGPWIRVTARHTDAAGVVHVRLPFERFYLEESLAPAAERALRRRVDGPVPAWLVVRVLDGVAVPEALLIEGVPVRDWVEADR